MTANWSQMIVTWTTFDKTNTSTVEYGINSIDKLSVGYSTLFVDGGNESRALYIHRVILTGLRPGQKYSERIIA